MRLNFFGFEDFEYTFEEYEWYFRVFFLTFAAEKQILKKQPFKPHNPL